jgi:hypothetical protein
MKMLLKDPDHAKELSSGAKKAAMEKFNIVRFKNDWLTTFEALVQKHSTAKTAAEAV